jgi:hypothetical protein
MSKSYKYNHHIIGEENGKYRYTGSESYSSATGQSNSTDSRANGATTNKKSRASKATRIRAGEIIAWRCWDWRDGALRSMSFTMTWDPTYPYHKAVNWYGGEYGDHCGFFAFKTLKDTQAEYRPYYGRVYGRVALWGQVFEHTLGYRAEYARIVSIDHARSGILDIISWESWFIKHKIRKTYNIPASFNGRTAASEAVNRGSNP